MGTRGVWGFYKGGESKLTYNHYDSYPDYLGDIIVNFVNTTPTDELNQIFNRIIMVDGQTIPTLQQVEECRAYANTDVSTRSISDWYCLLRETQGNPEAYKGSLRYMLNNNRFIEDSLFCE